MPKQKGKTRAKKSAPYSKSTKSNEEDAPRDPENGQDDEEILKCDKCKATVEGMIQCESCLLWHGCSCENFPFETVEVMKVCKTLHWYCEPCNSTANTQNQPVTGYEIANTIINGITEPLKNVIESLVKPITESLELLRGSLRPVQAGASMDIDATSDEVRYSTPKDTTTQVINEYVDRERRKCNVVIHGMSEESPSQDREGVSSLLESEFGVPKLSITSVTRLGKSSADKTRLLLVTLDQEHHKHAIMKKSHQALKKPKVEHHLCNTRPHC